MQTYSKVTNDFKDKCNSYVHSEGAIKFIETITEVLSNLDEEKYSSKDVQFFLNNLYKTITKLNSRNRRELRNADLSRQDNME